MTQKEYAAKVPAGTRISITIGGVKHEGTAFNMLCPDGSIDHCVKFAMAMIAIEADPSSLLN